MTDWTWRFRGRPRRVRALAAWTALALFLAAGMFFWSPSPAAAKDWSIQNMDVALDVQPDSDVLVSETITFAFEGQFSFVGRVIPTDNLDAIRDIEVLQDGTLLPEGSGPGTYEVFREGGDLIIQVNFDLTDTTGTWTFRYRAVGAIAYYDDADEFVWHVFDAETPVIIEAVRATVRLPGAVAAEDLDWAVDTGVAVETGVSSPAPSTVVFDAGRFFPYTKYWIAVGFPKGVVEFSWTWRRALAFLVPRIGFVLPIAAFLGMLLVWFRRGRDDPAAVFAKYTAEPPSSLPPAAAGALLDERVESRELFATLADLARRGYLELPDSTVAQSKWVFRRLKPLDDLKDLDAFVASRLFASGDERVTFDKARLRLSEAMGTFDDAVFGYLLRLKLFAETPAAARRRWKGRAVLLALILGAVTVFLAFNNIGGWAYFLLGSLVSVAVVYGFARVMPQRTAAGAQEQRKWEAFRNYLDDLQSFDDVSIAQETFERHLPYAIAFGVERRWINRFALLAVPVPIWVGTTVGERMGGGQSDRSASAGPASSGAGGGAGPADGGRGPVTLDSASSKVFLGLDSLSSALISAPSSTGTGRGAWGSSRVTGSSGRSSSRSSSSRSSSPSSGGSSGGGFSGGGGGGGFRAG